MIQWPYLCRVAVTFYTQRNVYILVFTQATPRQLFVSVPSFSFLDMLGEYIPDHLQYESTVLISICKLGFLNYHNLVQLFHQARSRCLEADFMGQKVATILN